MRRGWPAGWPLALAAAALVVGALRLRHNSALDVTLAGLTLLLLIALVALYVRLDRRYQGVLAELAALRRRQVQTARLDPLTGLATREHFLTALKAAITEATPDQPPAVLLVDLDGFAVVNDALGHQSGDQLLTVTAGRLQAIAGPHDLVARVGGDEFAILIPHSTPDRPVTALADQLVRQLAAPVADVNGEIGARASIGVAVARRIPGDSVTAAADLLIRDAGVALRAAKSDGRGRYRTSDSTLRAKSQEQLELDRDLRFALPRDELDVFFQPLIRLRDETIRGAEALLRWRHPEHGLIGPGPFLPAAESAGLILDIDRWVLRQACAEAARWRTQLPEFKVHVNISAGHITSGTLYRDVTVALAAAGLPPDALILELTETALVSDTDTAGRVLTELANIGVQVALDDFGTGYSSLKYLRSLPIHTIKIDQAFISGLGDGGANDAVTRAVLDLARTLGLHQVAEGIETVAQASILKALDCEFGQGFYFARPMPAAALTPLLTAGPLVAGPPASTEQRSTTPPR